MKTFTGILFFLSVFQGVLMSAILDKVEINGVEVPLIFEEERILPIASMQVVSATAALFPMTVTPVSPNFPPE